MNLFQRWLWRVRDRWFDGVKRFARWAKLDAAQRQQDEALFARLTRDDRW